MTGTKAGVSLSDVLGQPVDGRLGVGVNSLCAGLSPENDVDGISVDATSDMVRLAAALHRGTSAVVMMVVAVTPSLARTRRNGP